MKRTNRREFLARAAALGVAAAVSPTLLPAGARAATPRKGGMIRMATELHGPDDQMDPIVFTSSIDYARGRATYNNLIQILDNMSLHPELAEEWSTNKNDWIHLVIRAMQLGGHPDHSTFARCCGSRPGGQQRRRYGCSHPQCRSASQKLTSCDFAFSQ